MTISFAAPVTNPFGLRDVGSKSTPTFVDLDADGDLDALVGERNGDLFYFKNIGTATAASFDADIETPFGLSNVSVFVAPTFADLDGDGDFDAFVGDRYGNTQYFQNNGTATAPSFTVAVANPFGLTSVGSIAKPSFADIDADGDLDALVGNDDGNTLYFQNIGTATAPSFTGAVTNPFGLSDVGYSATPTFADIDGDSDLDAWVGSHNGIKRYFENIGTASAANFATSVTDAFGLSDWSAYPVPKLADIDADGDLDLLLGTYDGNILFFENKPPSLTLTAPTAINYLDTAFNDTFTAESATLSATDPESDALTYGIESGTVSGATVTRVGTYGTLTLTTATGAYTYTPNDAAIEATGANTSEDFTVTVSDGTNTTTQTLTVNLFQMDATETNGNDILTGDKEADRFDALAGDDTIDGLGGNDTLNGGAGNDSLIGGKGNDKLIGGAGNDTYVVDSAGDVVTETATLASEIDTVLASISYSLGANVERLTLTNTGNINGTGNTLANLISGNAGNNALFGLEGNDTINGGLGNDTIFSGLGNDKLTGGSGNDRFAFNTLGATNYDTITDFIKGTDKIVLDDDFFGRLGTGTLAGKSIASANYKVGAAAGDSNDYLIYDPATDKLFYDKDGNGSNAAVHIATITLTGTNAPALSDFLLIS